MEKEKIENIEDFRILLFKKLFKKAFEEENDNFFQVILEKLEKQEYEEFQLYFVDEKQNLDEEFERFNVFVDSWDLIILSDYLFFKILKENKEIQEIIQDLFEYPPKYQILYKRSTNEIFLFEILKYYNEIRVNVLIFKMPFKIYVVSDY